MNATRRTIGLRPMLPSDASALIEIFRAAILQLAQDDYDSDQLDAWASSADDAKAFATRLAASLTLVATDGEDVLGFASLKDNSVIDLLYVAPDHARQGVATGLCDALERLAQARGASQITTDASDTARDLFAARGYMAERRNMIDCNGEWLGNTTMRKAFAANTATAQH